MNTGEDGQSETGEREPRYGPIGLRCPSAGDPSKRASNNARQATTVGSHSQMGKELWRVMIPKEAEAEFPLISPGGRVCPGPKVEGKETSGMGGTGAVQPIS